VATSLIGLEHRGVDATLEERREAGSGDSEALSSPSEYDVIGIKRLKSFRRLRRLSALGCTVDILTGDVDSALTANSSVAFLRDPSKL
jgi:hypothetical protein